MRTAVPKRCATSSPRLIQRRTVRTETLRSAATAATVKKGEGETRDVIVMASFAMPGRNSLRLAKGLSNLGDAKRTSGQNWSGLTRLGLTAIARAPRLQHSEIRLGQLARRRCNRSNVD